MEKLYKYNTSKKLQELFKQYNRNNFSLEAYEFIIKNIKGYNVSQFDVVQVCEMYTEMSYQEIFDETQTTKMRESFLFNQFRESQKNIHLKRLKNGNYIYWHDEAIKELKEINKY